VLQAPEVKPADPILAETETAGDPRGVVWLASISPLQHQDRLRHRNQLGSACRVTVGQGIPAHAAGNRVVGIPFDELVCGKKWIDYRHGSVPALTIPPHTHGADALDVIGLHRGRRGLIVAAC
jgi:hypothetical protein